MRDVAARWLALGLLLLTPLLAQAAARPPAELQVTGVLLPAGNSLDDVLRTPLQPMDPRQPHATGPGRELWLRLRLPPADGPLPLVLEFPIPVVDQVTVYQQDGARRWTAQAAGDRVPMSRWPIAARYPTFPLAMVPGQAVEVYVQVRHATPLALPVQVDPAPVQQQRALLEYLAVGVAAGAVLLLVVHCLYRAWSWRDPTWLLMAAFAALGLLAVGAVTGVAAHLLWGEAGAWVDVAPGFIAMLAASTAVFVVGHLAGAVARMPRLARVLEVLGWLGLPLALAYAFMDRSPALAMLALYVFAVAACGIVAAALTARRGDVVGVWLLLGAVPLALAVLVTIGRSLSWVEPSWFTDYVLVAALLLELPSLLGALTSRSRERRGAHLRQKAAEHQDPLTGLPRAKIFHARVLHALERYARTREPATLAMIEVSNLAAIKAAHGDEVAQEALLRAVIKLRALLRDIDTAGRLGDARIGVILEGTRSREPAIEFATRLIAAGLMLEEGEAEIPLRFHVVLAQLAEYAPAAAVVLREMAALLSSMSARTRRPIRFLAPDEPGVDTGMSELPDENFSASA